jgi:hypothetical protein
LGAIGPAQAAHNPPTPPAKACTPGICVIHVYVDNCQAPGGIRVHMPYASTGGAVNLRWVIDTPGYVFAANGIEFDPADPQFEPKASPQPSEFRIQDHNSSAGDYYYYVNVQGCLQLDPWIKNQ